MKNHIDDGVLCTVSSMQLIHNLSFFFSFLIHVNHCFSCYSQQLRRDASDTAATFVIQVDVAE